MDKLELGGLLDVDVTAYSDKEFQETINKIRTQIITNPFQEVKLPADLTVDLISSEVLTDLDFKRTKNLIVPYVWIRDIKTLKFVIHFNLIESYHFFVLAVNLGDFETATNHKTKPVKWETVNLYHTKIPNLTKFMYLINEDITIIDIKESLIICAKKGYADIMEHILQVYPEAINSYPYLQGEILEMVVEQNHLDAVKVLITRISNVSTKYTALRIAAGLGHLEIVKTLISNGATFDNDGNVLVSAISNQHIHVVEFLISKYPNLNQQYRCFIVDAIEAGNLDIVKLLLQSGADINRKKDLVLTSSKSHKHIFDYLTDNFLFRYKDLEYLKPEDPEMAKKIYYLVDTKQYIPS